MELDTFEMKLLEFMHGIDFVLQDPQVQEDLRLLAAEVQGLIPADVNLNIPPADIDLELVHRIAVHLIHVEELGPDIPENANPNEDVRLYTALVCGQFIYSWEKEKPNERWSG